MASITELLSIPIPKISRQNNRNHKGNPMRIIWRKRYYIRYIDSKYKVLNSILAELRKHQNQAYTMIPKSMTVKTKAKVSLGKIDTTDLRFGGMKLLDALGFKYLPESVRVMKA